MMALVKYLRTFLMLLLVASIMAQSTEFYTRDVTKNIEAMNNNDNPYNPYREFNEWINYMVFSNVPGFGAIPGIISSLSSLDDDKKYYLSCYIRDLFAGTLVYWLTAGGWHIVIYKLFRSSLFDDKGRKLPEWSTITHQMWLAQRSLIIYAMLPLISEVLIENKVTKVYFYVDQIGGWPQYAVCFVLYLSLVEVGIYWMHRTLHTNKWLYNNIHLPHHQYNSEVTLTPWASIAFHPIDGMLQASPYVVCLFIIPMHYYTHMIMLFFTGMWATNIHDSLAVSMEPIMGSKYHTVHHTHYTFNYGQFFTFCDSYWRTLRAPKQENIVHKYKNKISSDMIGADDTCSSPTKEDSATISDETTRCKCGSVTHRRVNHKSCPLNTSFSNSSSTSNNLMKKSRSKSRTK